MMNSRVQEEVKKAHQEFVKTISNSKKNLENDVYYKAFTKYLKEKVDTFSILNIYKNFGFFENNYGVISVLWKDAQGKVFESVFSRNPTKKSIFIGDTEYFLLSEKEKKK